MHERRSGLGAQESWRPTRHDRLAARGTRLLAERQVRVRHVAGYEGGVSPGLLVSACARVGASGALALQGRWSTLLPTCAAANRAQLQMAEVASAPSSAGAMKGVGGADSRSAGSVHTAHVAACGLGATVESHGPRGDGRKWSAADAAGAWAKEAMRKDARLNRTDPRLRQAQANLRATLTAAQDGRRKQHQPTVPQHQRTAATRPSWPERRVAAESARQLRMDESREVAQHALGHCTPAEPRQVRDRRGVRVHCLHGGFVLQWCGTARLWA